MLFVAGVEYVAEYSDPRNQYQPGYLCSLCESRMNAAQAVRHFNLDLHILNYMVCTVLLSISLLVCVTA